MQRTDQNPGGILVPIRRHGSLYYRLSDVMKVYNGEL